MFKKLLDKLIAPKYNCFHCKHYHLHDSSLCADLIFYICNKTNKITQHSFYAKYKYRRCKYFENR